ncbi:MAG: hypothetical protein O3A63_02805 [Proteobacteria bacterium]|nr:hypothetical protein [Pseudomonadota bacterium]
MPEKRHAVHYLFTVVLAACSILYELVIAHKISLLASNTVIWYSVTVGLFLLGLGLGAFLSERLEKRFSAWKALFVVEVGLTALGALAVVLLNMAHMVFAQLYHAGGAGFGPEILFGTAFSLALAIGTLTGIELPLLISVGRKLNIRHATSVLLGLDYTGSLIGALAFPLILLPAFEPLGIGFGVAIINGLCALAIAWFAIDRRLIPIAFSASLVAVLLISTVQIGGIHQYFLKRYFYYIELGESLSTTFSLEDHLPPVFHASSPYQKINIVPDELPSVRHLFRPALSRKLSLPENHDFPGDQILTLDGRFQLNFSTEEIYHEYFAHVPIIATRVVPQKVLVLGAGDGLLIRELLKHPQIQIRHVDLDATLLDLAKNNPTFRRANRDALRDPRVDTRQGDGYYFIRNDTAKYDAIYIDFPAAYDYNLARLYSREFFQMVRARLNDRGFAVFDSTGTARLTPPDRNGNQAILPTNNWPVYYHTLLAAGFANADIHPFVTTLSFNHSELVDLIKTTDLKDHVINMNAEKLKRTVSDEHRSRLLETLIDQYAQATIPAEISRNQHGFIMLGAPGLAVSKEYVDLDLELYVLTPERYPLAFSYEYPFELKIRPDLVNSIMRPRFPTDPIWHAKLPY